eukprot:GHVL01007661.1.p1 GENE.GHVL01007661.1~~GHVL01007661.1.p1  ORF type:complete len:572 (+),score=140.68 GHVL01007661.1:22-1716(+)
MNNTDEEEYDENMLFDPEHSKQIKIPSHSKQVTAIAFNPRASRMVTGSLDTALKMWDFSGMTTDMKPFRILEPAEGHGIQGASYSSSGSHFICLPGDSTIRIYDNDGKFLQKTEKGDMYIRDTANTRGHTHMTLDCEWHPLEREYFISCAMDSTIRIWSLESKLFGIEQALPHVHCLKAIDRRNININNLYINCCKYAPNDGKFIVGGCKDGSIQIFNYKSRYNRPDKIIRYQHDGGVTGLCVFNDSIRIASRGLDNTLKLWDIRKFTEPTNVWSNLNNFNEKCNCCLSSDERYIITGCTGNSINLYPTKKDGGGSPKDITSQGGGSPVGVAVEKAADAGGSIAVIDLNTNTHCHSIGVDAAGAIRVAWPSEINQIFAGCTDGRVHVLYSNKTSTKGALSFAGRVPRTKEREFFCEPAIYVADDMGDFHQTKHGSIRRKKKELRDQRTVLPPKPIDAVGPGGDRLSQYLTQEMPRNDNPERDSLKLLREMTSDTAESDDTLVNRAYAKTQPKLILDYNAQLSEGDKLLQQSKICPRCGMRMCRCGYMKQPNPDAEPPQKSAKTS